jgi:Tol biopolymer transport system component
MIAGVGASGSGKSSVVLAGLVSHLRRGVGEQAWDIVTLVPGDRPLRALAAALVPVLEPEMTESERLVEIGELAGYFAEKRLALRDVVNRILEKQPDTNNLLLVVDQWEELYTLVHNDQVRQRFLDELLEATEGGMLTVVLTLRGDFFGRVLSHRGLADRLQDAVINLGPMTREELERAIEAPAQKVGLEFEPGLVGRILDDVEKEPGSLPLLEFVLTGLWERRRVGTLFHEAYEDIGEVRGAMARRADEVFGKLSSADQKIVRRVLIQLVRPGEGTDDTRRRATLAEVGDAARPLVRQLADARLTVTSRDEATGEQTVEVAHEALIQNWGRLRSWLDEDREFLLWRQRLRSALEQWEHADHDADALLRGVQLAEAESQYRERVHELTAGERRIIEESLDSRRRQQRSQRRRIAITKLVAAVMAILAIGTSLAWFYAYVSELEAEESAEEAKQQTKRAEAEAERAKELQRAAFARQLAIQAVSQPDNRQERGLLLAVESVRRYPTFEGDQALRRGLASLNHPGVILKHENLVHSVVYSPDGRLLATASDDRTAAVWEATTGEQIALVRHEHEVWSVAFDPNGRYIATASKDKTARIWDVNTGEAVTPWMNHEGLVWSVVFSPNGKYMATASWDNNARVWDANTGELIATIKHGDRVRCVVFSPDSKYLATASHDNTAGIWDATAGEAVTSMKHDDFVRCIAFSPDGKYVATGGRDDTARVYDWKTGARINRRSMNHMGNVDWIAFSPDSRYIATASDDSTARVWHAATGAQIACITHEAAVYFVAFSPDGRYVATAGWDNNAGVLNVATGEQVACISHENFVLSVAFSPDGKYLATASKDNTARMSLLRPEDLIAEASSRLGRNLDYREWQRFFPDEAYRKTCPDLDAHRSFLEAGRNLAKAGDQEGALAIFRRAKELEPDGDFDPNEEARRWAPRSDDQMGESHDAE